MPAPFAQTLRALDADSPRPALLAWAFAGAGLLAWGAWLGLGSVTLAATSTESGPVAVAPGEPPTVTARFAGDAGVAPGQTGVAILGAPRGARREAVVRSVAPDPDGGGVAAVIALSGPPPDRAVPVERIDLRIETLSPGRLLLRAAGLGADGAADAP